MKQLYEKGIKVQRVVKTENDEQYVLYEEKYYCLYEYVVGSVLEIKDTDKLERLASTIGEEIANLHKALHSVNSDHELIKEIYIRWYLNGLYRF